MRKLLILGFLGLIFYFFLRSKRKGGRPSPTSAATAADTQKMVSCAQCGVNFPQGESLSSAGQSFCCEEHRRLGSREREH